MTQDIQNKEQKISRRAMLVRLQLLQPLQAQLSQQHRAILIICHQMCLNGRLILVMVWTQTLWYALRA